MRVLRKKGVTGLRYRVFRSRVQESTLVLEETPVPENLRVSTLSVYFSGSGILTKHWSDQLYYFGQRCFICF